MMVSKICLQMFWTRCVNTSVATWWHISESTLVQVMVCCLTAPSHYLNQYLHVINKVLWHSSESYFTASVWDNILYNEFQNYIFEITSTLPRGQWVKEWLLGKQRWWAYYTYTFSMVIQGQLECRLHVIPFSVMITLHRFTHATTQ